MPYPHHRSVGADQCAHRHANPSLRLSSITLAPAQRYSFAWPVSTSRFVSSHSNHQVLGPSDLIHDCMTVEVPAMIRNVNWVLFTATSERKPRTAGRRQAGLQPEFLS